MAAARREGGTFHTETQGTRPYTDRKDVIHFIVSLPSLSPLPRVWCLSVRVHVRRCVASEAVSVGPLDCSCTRPACLLLLLPARGDTHETRDTSGRQHTRGTTGGRWRWGMCVHEWRRVLSRSGRSLSLVALCVSDICERRSLTESCTRLHMPTLSAHSTRTHHDSPRARQPHPRRDRHRTAEGAVSRHEGQRGTLGRRAGHAPLPACCTTPTDSRPHDEPTRGTTTNSRLDDSGTNDCARVVWRACGSDSNASRGCFLRPLETGGRF